MWKKIIPNRNSKYSSSNLEDKEEFLNNKHLGLVEMEEEITFESELMSAMNSIELSVDKMYKDINYCVCEMARQDIITS